MAAEAHSHSHSFETGLQLRESLPPAAQTEEGLYQPELEVVAAVQSEAALPANGLELAAVLARHRTFSSKQRIRIVESTRLSADSLVLGLEATLSEHLLVHLRCQN